MIRSNKTSLRFTNIGKIKLINSFVDRYTDMVKTFVNIIWNDDSFTNYTFVDNNICKQVSTNVKYDSRIRQCAAKQASAIVRAETAKRKAII